MDIFSSCKEIVAYLENNEHKKARDYLLLMLDDLKQNKKTYTPLVNHLIRKTGLYPYIYPETSHWTDQLLYEVFKSNVGGKEPAILHKEQSRILKKLLNNESLAVSAPTSFGKSFIIDAYISIKKPNNVVIIVPTISLTDETRRRINKKFSNQYKIITQSDISLKEKNIFIFPAERAFNYLGIIKEIDILIIDEFYKASPNFDKERAPSLLKVIRSFSQIAKQKYFLAPNISSPKLKILLEKIGFREATFDIVYTEFNTVYTEVENLYISINSKEKKKKSPLREEMKKKALLQELKSKETKSLIYAGTYPEVKTLTNLFIEKYKPNSSKILDEFAEWLNINYGPVTHELSELVKRGVGIHNGRLHRSLGQIQVKLFEEKDGLSVFITTSSMIEGVNTSAENVFLWSDKKANLIIDTLTYKNIIGRGGRMFKHFVGKVFLLEKPPEEKDRELTNFDNETMSHMKEFQSRNELTPKQRKEVQVYEKKMNSFLGENTYKKLQKDKLLQSNNSTYILNVAKEIYDKKKNGNSLNYLNNLNNKNSEEWGFALYLCIKNLKKVETEYSKFISFIKIINNNWDYDVPEILKRLKKSEIEEKQYFQLERIVTFKFTSAMKDLSTLCNSIYKEKEININPFISRASHAFLPKLVFQLEEYGLPRMISKKIQASNILNLLDKEKSIDQLLGDFIKIGKKAIKSSIQELHPFDSYIIDYFYDGIVD